MGGGGSSEAPPNDDPTAAPETIVFRQGLSFTDLTDPLRFGRTTLRSPSFPESWPHQWYIEVSTGFPSSVSVDQHQYSESPCAELSIKIADKPPITIEWPAGRREKIFATFPSNVTYKELMSNSADKTLTMNVILTIYVTSEHAHLAENRGRAPIPRDFCGQFKTLLENGLASDVTIISKRGQTLVAHWAVLGARSPFFAAMIKFDCKEKKLNKVKLNIDHEICEKMLEFIYSDQVEITDVVEGQNLLEAGDLYQVDGLKTAAEEFLCSHATTENALELLIFSHLHCAKKLKLKTLNVISRDSKLVTDHTMFPELLKYPDLVGEVLTVKNSPPEQHS